MKIERRYSDYDVYLLDMWGNEDDGYEENQRFLVGRIQVLAPTFEDVSEVGILRAMKKLEIADIVGHRCKALTTMRRDVVYIEDLYGTGLWWEIGDVKTRKPVYGLEYVGAHVA